MSRATFLPTTDLVAAPAARRSAAAVAWLTRLVRAETVIAATAGLTGVLAAAMLLSPAYVAVGAENVLAVLTPAACTIAMVMLWRSDRPHQLSFPALAASLAFATLGMLVLDLRPALGHTETLVGANALFAVGTTLCVWTIGPALYRRLDRRAAAAAGLDGAIMLLVGITLLLSLWQARLTEPSDLVELLPAVLAISILASVGLGTISALAMRAEFAPRGIWAALAGVGLIGLTWIWWLDRALHGADRGPGVTVLFSAGVIVLAVGWTTWNDRIGRGRIFEALARTFEDWLPIGALLVLVVLDALPHNAPGFNPAPLGTAAVVLVAIGRQRLLLLGERDASRRLGREVEERAATMLSLARLEPATTVEETAGRICAEALRLEGIEIAGIYAFGPGTNVIPLALAGSSWAGETVGEPISEARAHHLRVCSITGPWLDSAADSARTGRGALLGEAFAPMHFDDRIVGVVSMGTMARESAMRLPERLSTVTEFGVVSAAMLGPMLAEHWRREDLRSQLEHIILTHAFRPVFQPVMDLATRQPVGFEALTRFGDGTRPDRRFVEADSVGMSIRLETACLAEQLEAAAWLPKAAWVSLNVSPALASAVVPLIAALERTDREVVLEITEHVEIADYRRLVDALGTVRGRARLAVDDAGAGYAGLRHILELRPQYVKLDISLVRSIDADPARQAMVAGMAHFAHNAGCELIAEGIETQQELDALIALGIGLGQGYLLGRPTALD